MSDPHPEYVTRDLAKIEYAQGYVGGSMLVLPPEIADRVGTRELWIEGVRETGGKVYRRLVIVVDDWKEVER